jgi:hypothetical protein
MPFWRIGSPARRRGSARVSASRSRAPLAGAPGLELSRSSSGRAPARELKRNGARRECGERPSSARGTGRRPRGAEALRPATTRARRGNLPHAPHRCGRSQRSRPGGRSPAAVSQSFLPIRIRVALAAAIAVARSCATPARGAWAIVPATTVPARSPRGLSERGASEDDDLLGNPSRLVAASRRENAEVAAGAARGSHSSRRPFSSPTPAPSIPSLDLGVGGINVGESVPPTSPRATRRTTPRG